MRRELHVRFCEGGGVRFPSATRRIVVPLLLAGLSRFLPILPSRAHNTRSSELLRALLYPIGRTAQFFNYGAGLRPGLDGRGGRRHVARREDQSWGLTQDGGADSIIKPTDRSVCGSRFKFPGSIRRFRLPCRKREEHDGGYYFL
jgi:hypothetical protein